MTITPEQEIEYMELLYERLISKDLAKDTIVITGSVLLASIKNRIENEGRDSTDKPIGQYSTKSIYATEEQFVKGGAFKAGGKTGKLIPTVHVEAQKGLKLGHKFVPLLKQRKGYKRYSVVTNQNKPHASMYLKDGYKELRDIQGLRTDVVNFRYRGDLLESYQSQKDGQQVLLGITDESQAKKREGLESRFGNVFYATPEEIEEYEQRTNFLLARLTRNTLKGYDVTAEIS